MNKTLFFEKLTSIGLDDGEARLYLFLLENGNKTPLQISRETEMNRNKAYRVLEDLEQKKLVEVKFSFERKTYQASPPENLELLLIEEEEKLRTHKENLSDLIKNLNQITNSLDEDFQIKHYKGEDGLKQMIWNELTAGVSEILVFGYETRNELVGKKFAEKTRLEQIRRNIHLFELENIKDQGKYYYTDLKEWPRFYDSKYIPSKILRIKQQTIIYADTVSILSWKNNKKIGVEIINKAHADMQKQIFWKFWRMAE